MKGGRSEFEDWHIPLKDMITTVLQSLCASSLWKVVSSCYLPFCLNFETSQVCGFHTQMTKPSVDHISFTSRQAAVCSRLLYTRCSGTQSKSATTSCHLHAPLNGSGYRRRGFRRRREAAAQAEAAELNVTATGRRHRWRGGALLLKRRKGIQQDTK